ncbi:hypothetical protein CBOM_01123 [Ceraceosorus bombacis]|uniref:Zn(2)-C6 fungal-type domain-containing protein n=1 Tax=Ceraceosorus bombacis TaxID=401625 RepID=A0A0P1BCL3_9BASI|nr:hypothetical protein CBOM_01123 [Ceraceosorus bombacis]
MSPFADEASNHTAAAMSPSSHAAATETAQPTPQAASKPKGKKRAAPQAPVPSTAAASPAMSVGRVQGHTAANPTMPPASPMHPQLHRNHHLQDHNPHQAVATSLADLSNESIASAATTASSKRPKVKAQKVNCVKCKTAKSRCDRSHAAANTAACVRCVALGHRCSFETDQEHIIRKEREAKERAGAQEEEARQAGSPHNRPTASALSPARANPAHPWLHVAPNGEIIQGASSAAFGFPSASIIPQGGPPICGERIEQVLASLPVVQAELPLHHQSWPTLVQGRCSRYKLLWPASSLALMLGRDARIHEAIFQPFDSLSAIRAISGLSEQHQAEAEPKCSAPAWLPPDAWSPPQMTTQPSTPSAPIPLMINRTQAFRSMFIDCFSEAYGHLMPCVSVNNLLRNSSAGTLADNAVMLHMLQQHATSPFPSELIYGAAPNEKNIDNLIRELRRDVDWAVSLALTAEASSGLDFETIFGLLFVATFLLWPRDWSSKDDRPLFHFIPDDGFLEQKPEFSPRRLVRSARTGAILASAYDMACDRLVREGIEADLGGLDMMMLWSELARSEAALDIISPTHPSQRMHSPPPPISGSAEIVASCLDKMVAASSAQQTVQPSTQGAKQERIGADRRQMPDAERSLALQRCSLFLRRCAMWDSVVVCVRTMHLLLANVGTTSSISDSAMFDACVKELEDWIGVWNSQLRGLRQPCRPKLRTLESLVELALLEATNLRAQVLLLRYAIESRAWPWPLGTDSAALLERGHIGSNAGLAAPQHGSLHVHDHFNRENASPLHADHSRQISPLPVHVHMANEARRVLLACRDVLARVSTSTFQESAMALCVPSPTEFLPLLSSAALVVLEADAFRYAARAKQGHQFAKCKPDVSSIAHSNTEWAHPLGQVDIALLKSVIARLRGSELDVQDWKRAPSKNFGLPSMFSRAGLATLSRTQLYFAFALERTVDAYDQRSAEHRIPGFIPAPLWPSRTWIDHNPFRAAAVSATPQGASFANAQQQHVNPVLVHNAMHGMAGDLGSASVMMSSPPASAHPASLSASQSSPPLPPMPKSAPSHVHSHAQSLREQQLQSLSLLPHGTKEMIEIAEHLASLLSDF